MANIGSFKKSSSEFQGEIVTLSVQTKNVRIVPETNRANDSAPSHRIYVGRAGDPANLIQAAQPTAATTSSVKLDDPSFIAPIYANLFNDEDGDGFTLIWSRGPQGQRRLSQPSAATPRPIRRARPKRPTREDWLGACNESERAVLRLRAFPTLRLCDFVPIRLYGSRDANHPNLSTSHAVLIGLSLLSALAALANRLLRRRERGPACLRRRSRQHRRSARAR